MPTVTLNRKVVEDMIGKKLSLEELKEAISFVGTDLEEITDDEIHVEIFPNRPDMLSEQGLGRALASYLGVKKGLVSFDVKPSGLKLVVEKSASGVRPNTACAIVKGLKLDDERIREIIQIQEKLHVTYGRNRKKCAIGVYPLSKIEFPVKLCGLDPKVTKFIPLESPRGLEMTGEDILELHPTGKEYASLLSGLDKFPFFVDAKGDVLSMPPVINSELTGRVDETTTDVFVECSGFDQKVLDICLNMIVSALSDMGGSIESIELVNEIEGWSKTSPAFECREIDVEVSYVNKLLGTSMSEADVSDALMRMGYGYQNGVATVPSYRADVLHQCDLVEDIAIAYGYDNFELSIPNCATVGSLDKVELMKSRVGNILSGLGLFETNTYCLIGEKQITTDVFSDKKFVKLANSVAEGYDCMRNSMLPSLLMILRNNRNREYPQGFYETGLTFNPDESCESKISEGRNLAFVYADSVADYTYARQVLDYLFKSIGLAYTVKTGASKTFMEGRCAEVFVDDVSIGFVGQLSPAVLENYELEVPACGFDIDFLELVKRL